MQAPQGSDEWRKARVGCLTSSIMHTVMYGTHKGWNSLMDRMQFELEHGPALSGGGPGPRQLRFGKEYEEIALENAILDYGWECVRPPFVRHPTVDYIGASSDFIVIEDFEKVANGEIKCRENHDEHNVVLMSGQVPVKHHAQIVCQMFVHDLPVTKFLSFDPTAPDYWSRLSVVEFPRDASLEQLMLDRCGEFIEIFRRGDRAKPRGVSGKTGVLLTDFQF